MKTTWFLMTWTEPRLHWHINCLELLEVLLSLLRFQLLIGLVNTTTVTYINRQCQSQTKVTVVHSPPRRAQSCSRRDVTASIAPRRVDFPAPACPADLESIRESTGWSVHFPGILPMYLLYKAPLIIDALAHSWPRGLWYKVREHKEQVLLFAPYWLTRTWFLELMFLKHSLPGGSL